MKKGFGLDWKVSTRFIFFVEVIRILLDQSLLHHFVLCLLVYTLSSVHQEFPEYGMDTVLSL